MFKYMKDCSFCCQKLRTSALSQDWRFLREREKEVQVRGM